jgi:predicted metal-dependent hydrolase
VKTIERRMRKIMTLFNRVHTPMQRLAMTVGAEHFTSMVARFLLRHPEYLARFRDVEARRLVMWHALEEREHRAVAFDVYERAGGSYILRAVMLPWMFGVLAPWIAFEVVRVMVQFDGFEDRAALRRGLSHVVGDNGILTKICFGMRDYFRRDFHPNDDDQSALEAGWRRELGWEDERTVPAHPGRVP